MSVARPFLIGTAGHVDHGKTTLVQALTGVNTDRLEEERRRGMSIELGFAEFRLPSGRLAGIVDVPGHERFLKNMLAGAWGVDFGLLVVGADEGVMPQTREHLAILQALRVKRGLTAITKADTVEPDWLDMVRGDVAAALAGTFLERAPILAVDSVSGRGLAELARLLDETAAELPEPDVSRPAFLPVDRVFHRQGFGVVVTGSLRSGRLREGDSVMIYPSGKPARIRGLQTFGEQETEAEAGMRTAANLSGISADDVARGDVIAPPGSLIASQRMNVRLQMEPGTRALKHRSRVRVHIGTAEILARALLWEGPELPGGSAGLAQLNLEEPAVARRGDRFVVRWYSPQDLLGGGEVLEPVALAFRSRDEGILRRLQALESGDPRDIVREALAAAGAKPCSGADLAAATGLSEAAASSALQAAIADGGAVATKAGAVDAAAFARLRRKWTERLAAHHKKAPLRPGMPKEALRTQDSPPCTPAAFDALLGALEGMQALVVEQDTVRLPEFGVRLRPDQEANAEEILALYRDAGWQPPFESEVTRVMGPHRATRELWDYLTASGRLVSIGEGLLLHADVVEAGVAALRRLLAERDEVSIGDFKDAVGASRRSAVPFLEWCDTRRLTRRLTDGRTRGPKLP
ncbi:MAG TPA: selenocysteine-specific translation elongation factor [Armatimonadota bacterium]|jgi:selenocysteine-specific elongation factor